MRVTPSNSSSVVAAAHDSQATAHGGNPTTAQTVAQARKALRKELRAKRRAASPEFRAKAARQVARNVDRVFRLRPGLRVAIYASFPEELDSGPLIRLPRNRRRPLFLPRIPFRPTPHH